VRFRILLAGICLAARLPLQAQHGHLNAGAETWQQNAKLNFANAAAFVASSGYVKTMVYSNTGTFASTYNGNISLTALHSVNAFGESVPGSPAPGSFIVAEIVSVRGPEGSSFILHDENGAGLIVPAGTTNGGFRYELSDASLGSGQPGADPYGHLHGRRFALDKPGVYTVGIRAVDISTNGIEGGPIHIPSDILDVTFQAGINLTDVDVQHDRVRVRFGGMANYVWQVESIDSLSSTNWQAVGEPLPGRDFWLDIDDLQPVSPTRFYRVRGEVVIP
jgi:hypothetical protein